MLKPSPRRPRLLASLALFMAVSACASDAAISSKPQPAASGSDALLIALQAEIKDAACDGAQQCHSMAIGSKPCGGPDGYLAWSSKRTDAQRLSALVERHAAARKAENLRNALLSTCVFETDPGARCQDKRCVLGPRVTGGLPDDPR